jgi:polyhydroxybutyrate depolymerase
MHVDQTITSSDTTRTYKQYVPEPYDGSPTPLVVDLHGYLSGADVQTRISELGTLAESPDFIVATPQGTSEMPYWNATPEATLPDDVQFVSDVIDDVSARLCIDPARVYVDGFSNGAFLASLVACRLADQVAAIAAVSGLMYPTDCAPSRPVPILAIHGTADEFVSFEGAPNAALDTMTWNADSRKAFAGLPFDDVTVAQANWGKAQGCATAPTQRRVSSDIELIELSGCQGGSTVQLYEVDGGGHTWPGSQFSKASESILGKTTFDLDASKTIWAFFQEHPMPR